MSLADVYDIEGSIAGVEQLQSRDVNLVHEMGSTLFSERLSERIFRTVSGDIAQSTAFGFGITGLPNIAARVLALMVIVDVTSRITNCVVNLSTTSGPLSEIPVWAWDTTNESTLRFFENGTVANHICLNSDAQYDRLPTIMTGSDQPVSIGGLGCRGTTSAFGAGTVALTLNALIAFSEIRGISSRGLPIPSW